MAKHKNPCIGETIDEFLEEEGLMEAVRALEQKRELAAQLRKAMVRAKVSEAAMARRMKTSRTQVRRLLDPNDDSASMTSMARAAAAVGAELVVGLRFTRPRPRK